MPKSNRIWIIDDDRSIRWVLEKALTSAGLETRTFEYADGALRQLNHDTPDVIISDIRMPGTDGLALANNLRANHPHIALIVITAHADLESAVAAYQGGRSEERRVRKECRTRRGMNAWTKRVRNSHA